MIENLAALSVLVFVLAVIGASGFLMRYFVGLGIGAPWLPIHTRYLKVAFDMIELKPGDVVIDLGSGDGKILIQAAKCGARVTGYELNPLLAWASRLRLKRWGSAAQIYRKNLFESDVTQADYIFVFGITSIMARLAEKLNAEARPDAKIISFAFELPGLTLIEEKEIVKIYSIVPFPLRIDRKQYI